MVKKICQEQKGEDVVSGGLEGSESDRTRWKEEKLVGGRNGRETRKRMVEEDKSHLQTLV